LVLILGLNAVSAFEKTVWGAYEGLKTQRVHRWALCGGIYEAVPQRLPPV